MRNYKHICDNIENVENYEKAKVNNFKGWECHHRLETHNSDGARRITDISRNELIALNMYWHRPAEELIFMTRSEHNILHNLGSRQTEKTKNKISEKKKGRCQPEEEKRKQIESQIGKHWFNNGKINKFCYECPEGFVKGRAGKKHWFNNDFEEVFKFECPEGFVPGRLKRIKEGK